MVRNALVIVLFTALLVGSVGLNSFGPQNYASNGKDLSGELVVTAESEGETEATEAEIAEETTADTAATSPEPDELSEDDAGETIVDSSPAGTEILVSEVYRKVAMDAGIDPEDDSVMAIIALLGSAYDEESLTLTTRVYKLWHDAYLREAEVKPLFNTRFDEQSGKIYLDGYEVYLLIPRYEVTTATLVPLEFSADFNLVEAADADMRTKQNSGIVIIEQNVSDLFPNAKIILRFGKDSVEFSPYISLKDGSLVLPEEVRDVSHLFSWQAIRRLEDAPYHEGLYQLMYDLIHFPDIE